MGFDLLRSKGDVTKNQRLKPLGQRALSPYIAVFSNIYIKMDWKRLRVVDASPLLH